MEANYVVFERTTIYARGVLTATGFEFDRFDRFEFDGALETPRICIDSFKYISAPWQDRNIEVL